MDDDFDAFGSSTNPKTEGGIDSQKSLQDLMREKREKTE
jgi:hypothetical protein